MEISETNLATKFDKAHLVESITILGVFLACFLFLLHRIEVLEAKQDVRIQEQAERNTKQAERTDRLYEIVIEILKDKKTC